MTQRRVVITGMGTVNPVGNTVKEFWDGLLTGKSGLGMIDRFDTSAYTSRIGGQVKWSGVAPEHVHPRESRKMDRFCQYAVQASCDAVDDSGIDFAAEDVSRCGVLVGSGIGGLETLEAQTLRAHAKGPMKISPFTVPRLMVNAASGHLGIRYGLMGPNFSVVTACASAAHAIGEAMHVIQRDDADVMITGGSEATICMVGLASFCSLRGLSTRNDDPTVASRPWDKDRDGFVLAEGAGCMIIEELEHAKARGATIYGELVGYGASCDANHITAPHPNGDGAALAMRACVASAGMNFSDIGYINAHGTSTPLGDIAETNAIKKVFGDWATDGLTVSSTKSLTGHMLGASGGVELIACVKAMQDNVLPATYNHGEPSEGCDLDYIPNQPREVKVDAMLSNSFGFGGHNGCLILKRFED
ncbi:MAG: beta-ketoacyl-ACP synthase II [Phycisphaerales bacterium]|jgi:3-oxoacyl-[acyl-carrier-protein] synthase II|nr:beta-ketoacyl-ACP synthase II [Phycisphaerales bacterium]MBT7170190.1 beta-ketoacyl-ACP synthase II [Phycisphaerales bacterium]